MMTSIIKAKGLLAALILGLFLWNGCGKSPTNNNGGGNTPPSNLTTQSIATTVEQGKGGFIKELAYLNMIMGITQANGNSFQFPEGTATYDSQTQEWTVNIRYEMRGNGTSGTINRRCTIKFLAGTTYQQYYITNGVTASSIEFAMAGWGNINVPNIFSWTTDQGNLSANFTITLSQSSNEATINGTYHHTYTIEVTPSNGPPIRQENTIDLRLSDVKASLSNNQGRSRLTSGTITGQYISNGTTKDFTIDISSSKIIINGKEFPIDLKITPPTNPINPTNPNLTQQAANSIATLMGNRNKQGSFMGSFGDYWKFMSGYTPGGQFNIPGGTYVNGTWIITQKDQTSNPTVNREYKIQFIGPNGPQRSPIGAISSTFEITAGPEIFTAPTLTSELTSMKGNFSIESNFSNPADMSIKISGSCNKKSKMTFTDPSQATPNHSCEFNLTSMDLTISASGTPPIGGNPSGFGSINGSMEGSYTITTQDPVTNTPTTVTKQFRITFTGAQATLTLDGKTFNLDLARGKGNPVK